LAVAVLAYRVRARRTAGVHAVAATRPEAAK
jgi:hypothetical protein